MFLWSTSSKETVWWMRNNVCLSNTQVGECRNEKVISTWVTAELCACHRHHNILTVQFYTDQKVVRAMLFSGLEELWMML